MKRADATMNNSSSMLGDEELFGCPDTCVITGCEEELNVVFGVVNSLVKGTKIFNFKKVCD